ncbi:MAG: nucleoid-associated protein [Coriobacteriia bacterium]|nr:nucleoid-associated protein [Coriobacteriia bacterium]
MNINHAILHVFDFVACENTFSAEEIDLADKTAKGYVARLAGKALNDLDAKRGEFSPESRFADELRSYVARELDFVTLSRDIGEYLARELGHMEKPVSCDLLVVDFQDAPVKVVDEMTDEEVAARFEGREDRYLGVIMLESKQAYVHDLGFGEVGERCGIERHRAVLPNPSQKIPTYAVIDLKTFGVRFADKPRTIDGAPKLIVPDGLLQCSIEASSKENFAAVAEVVEAVAEEYGANTAVVLSRAKAYVSQNAEEADDVDLEALAEDVFADNEPMRQRFEEVAQAYELPERVTVEREAARRVAAKHKIRTDTGIEITFPAEYSRNPEYLTFTSEADGTYSIQLKNIGHIENR